MNKNEILDFISDSGIENVEEINYRNDLFLIKFQYVFDKYEISAAKEFADGECSKENEEDIWYDKCYLPFLNDITVDNVDAAVEDCMDEFGIKADSIVHDVKDRNCGYSEGLAVFSEANKEFDIDKIAKDIKFEL